jgi:hypothetical protein
MVLATTAPDTTAVVMSCVLRDSVAFDIQEDILTRGVGPLNHPNNQSLDIYVQRKRLQRKESTRDMRNNDLANLRLKVEMEAAVRLAPKGA